MTKEDLQRVLLADLGQNYDPLDALRFLRILESKTKCLTKSVENLEDILNNPPTKDTRLQTIYRTPYVLGEVVLAGTETRTTHPLCNYHIIHFKKTYLQKLSRWETNPLHEAQQSHKVWLHFQEEAYTDTGQQYQKVSKESETLKGNLGGESNEQNHVTRARVPLPLGASPTTFRSQIIVGKTLASLSPVKHAGNPSTTLKQILQAKKSYGPITKLWEGLTSLNKTTNILHKGGFLHNDLHRENLFLQEIDGHLKGSLIDFETTEEDELFQSSQWDEETKRDKKDLIKESCLIYLCANSKEREKINADGDPLLNLVLKFIKSDPLMIYLEKMLK
jgi:hypothetical protein